MRVDSRPLVKWVLCRKTLIIGLKYPFQLIEFTIKTHPAYNELLKITEERKSNIHEGEIPSLGHKDIAHGVLLVLHDQLVKIQKEEGFETFTEVIKDMHMYPDLHGK
jgi:hypothetical protein